MTAIASTQFTHSAAIRPRATLALVILATALSSLEVGLVNVALPTLAATFGVGLVTIQWVVLAYQLAIVSTLVLFGRLVDLFGGRRLYLSGMAAIATASLLATASQSALWLILARGLLGLGAAMLLSTGQALVATAYPDAGRGRALGVMHMAVAGGLMAGPAIGGLLLATIGWRAVFLAPVPLALGTFFWAWKILPRGIGQRHMPLDYAGALLIFIVVLTSVLGMTQLARHGWGGRAAVLIFLAMSLSLLLVVVERRRPAPLIDLSLLAHWNISAGVVVAFLTFIALASNMFLIPFALQDLMGYPAAPAGLLMMTAPLAILPTALLSGILADRIGNRLPATAGLVLIVGAIVGMSQFRTGTAIWFVLAVLILYGVGAGLFQAPNNSAVLGAAPADRVGTISGMLALSRNLGQITGIALASTVWTWRQAHYEQITSPPLSPLALGLRDGFLVLAGFGAVAMVISMMKRNQKERTS
ncbi:MFS transporter [soil metagenome]